MKFKCFKSVAEKKAESQAQFIKKMKGIERLNSWHTKFAWFPIHEPISGRCAWLETVEVRYPGAWSSADGIFYGDREIRLKENDQNNA